MRVPQVSERIKEAPAQALRGVFAGIGQLLLYTDKLRNKAPFGQEGPYARVPGPPLMATPPPAPTEPAPDRAAGAPASQGAAAEATVTETPEAPKTPKASRDPKTPKTPVVPKAPVLHTEIRDFDKTGNVRLITGDEARADEEPPAVPEPEPAPPATAEEHAPPATAEEHAPPATAEEHAPPVAAGEHAPAGAGEPAAGPADPAPPLPNYDELSIASLRARLRNLDVTQVRELVEYEKGHAGRTDVLVMLERRIAKLEAGD